MTDWGLWLIHALIASLYLAGLTLAMVGCAIGLMALVGRLYNRSQTPPSQK